MKNKNTLKRRNPIASELSSPLYRQRIVKSKKVYSRKNVKVKHNV